MSAMSTPESQTYLAHLMAEMLGVQNLPADLKQAISNHLNSQLSLVNVLKPEYCRRLYPILLELAEMSNCAEADYQTVNGAAPESNDQHDQGEDEEQDDRVSAY